MSRHIIKHTLHNLTYDHKILQQLHISRISKYSLICQITIFRSIGENMNLYISNLTALYFVNKIIILKIKPTVTKIVFNNKKNQTLLL